jgi:peroxiredoxin
MHRKYGPQGLVAVSVSLDDPSEKETEAEIRKFLQKEKATQSNFLLNEVSDVWEKKLGIEGVPCVFVFNRAGKIEKKYPNEFPKHEELEKLVERLLRQK